MANYFSKNLKYLREKKNLEQQILADELKIPRSTLTCWENGLRTPKIQKIEDIANYFGVGMDIISKDYSIEENNTSTLDKMIINKTKKLSVDKKEKVNDYIDSLIKK